MSTGILEGYAQPMAVCLLCSKENNTMNQLDRQHKSFVKKKCKGILTIPGFGVTAAKQVISVRCKDTGEELLKDSDEVTYKDGKIRFGREWVDKCAEDTESMPRSLVIAFDDVDLTEIEITLK